MAGVEGVELGGFDEDSAEEPGGGVGGDEGSFGDGTGGLGEVVGEEGTGGVVEIREGNGGLVDPVGGIGGAVEFEMVGPMENHGADEGAEVPAEGADAGELPVDEDGLVGEEDVVGLEIGVDEAAGAGQGVGAAEAGAKAAAGLEAFDEGVGGVMSRSPSTGSREGRGR